MRDLMEAVRVSERKKKRPKSTNRHGNVPQRGPVQLHGPLLFESHRISQDALHCISVWSLSLKPKHGVKGRLWSFWPTYGPPVHNGTGEIFLLDLASWWRLQLDTWGRCCFRCFCQCMYLLWSWQLGDSLTNPIWCGGGYHCFARPRKSNRKYFSFFHFS